jgi:hypothetical protein
MASVQTINNCSSDAPSSFHTSGVGGRTGNDMSDTAHS